MNNICYMLGLNEDCSSWNISVEEKKMRFNLWWINYIQNKWISCTYGLPNTIDDLSHNITSSSYLKNDDNNYFLYFIKITQILSDLHKDLFTFSAEKHTEDAYLQLCDDYEGLLFDWDKNLPKSYKDTNCLSSEPSVSIGSLRLCYFVLHILIFRARFKTIGSEKFKELFHTNAFKILEEAIVFLNSLKLENITGNWLSFTKSLLIYMKDLLILSGKNEEMKSLTLSLTKQFKEWLERNAKTLEICWPALLRLNVATESLGKQFRS